MIDGIEPCAPAVALGATVPAARRSLWFCEFDYHGDRIKLEYVFAGERLTLRAPAFTVGTHRAHRFDEPGDDLVIYWGRIGPPVENSSPVGSMGPSLPTVTVTGYDVAAVEDVVRSVVSMIPAP
ncbi:hypothetical protein [Nocardia carnea]|uniref:Uncharacterized protein n=1 Tax=Nocardia carnea TaxID=37328 RepID=A0ABW7THX1_9NOCA|nr:hypothetical protein [Nocardia carnea]